MKQLLPLFLFLLPCLALAQYPSNGNQKITLGEQSTADGLIYRGVAATDTARKPSIDTMAYMVLDTTTNIMWHYKKATSNAWLRLNLLPSDTASMLTNYYRSGRTGIIQASDVPTLNQNTTGSAATLTTSRTFQTNLASTSTASFNGSANVTPGVTGTLPVANGGTGASVKIFVDTINNQTINGEKTFSSSLKINSAAQYPRFFFNSNFVGNAAPGMTFQISNVDKWAIAYEVNSAGLLFFQEGVGTNVFFKNGGNVGIGTTNPAVQFHTTGGVRFAGLVNYDPVETDADGDIIDGGASDFNLKNSIEPINYGLNSINQLKPVSYLWNDVNRKLDSTIPDIGFIAQDVMDVIPEAVRSNGDGDLQLNYKAITATLVKAIQEQQALIKALEQRIINLENK
jgi:hypothetical protein